MGPKAHSSAEDWKVLGERVAHTGVDLSGTEVSLRGPVRSGMRQRTQHASGEPEFGVVQDRKQSGRT